MRPSRGAGASVIEFAGDLIVPMRTGSRPRSGGPHKSAADRSRMPQMLSPLGASSDLLDGKPLDLSAAGLFEIIWDTLADVLGTAAVAAIVRRAARRAAATQPERAGLT